VDQIAAVIGYPSASSSAQDQVAHQKIIFLESIPIALSVEILSNTHIIRTFLFEYIK
jgi:hypothetical protein